MNDFLYTTNPDDKDTIEMLLRRRCDLSCKVVSNSGSWGAFVSIARPSTPHLILDNEDYLFLLIGNPSFQGRFVASPKFKRDESAIASLVAESFRDDKAIPWHNHFNGQFAIVAVDKSTGVLFMASDMLQFITMYHTAYVYKSEHQFVCGSQINHVAEMSRHHELDPVSIAESMLYKTTTDPFTFLKGIFTVPPASVLFRYPDDTAVIRRYWGPDEPETIDFTIDECAAELRRFAESNLEQVTRDYDSIAILLSGGSDSRAVAGMLRGNPNVEALTFSESINRETGLARQIAELADLPFRLFSQNSDFYLDHIDECTELAGLDQFFIHSHLLSVWKGMGLDQKDVVLGGFFADVLLKGNQLPHKPLIPGCGFDTINKDQLQQPVNPALSPELLDAAHNRRLDYLDRLKQFRPTTSKAFEVVFPLSMDDALCYTAVNRRLFNDHELFSDNRIVELACKIPYSWKLNDHLFRRAFLDIFRQFKSVPHTTGKRCQYNAYLNMPFCLANTVRKKIQLQINKRLGSNQNIDPWRQSPGIVQEARKRGYFKKYLQSDAFREAVGHDIDLERMPDVTSSKGLLFVMQVAKYYTNRMSNGLVQSGLPPHCLAVRPSCSVTALPSTSAFITTMSTHPQFPDSIRTVALTGGTHGDELTGVHLVRAAQQDPTTVERPGLTVMPLITNDAAVAAGRRYLEHDLNRAFAASELADMQLDAPEQTRAKQLNALLGPKGPATKTDLILDFHSAASDMGLNCNITGEDPWLFRLAALAIHRLAEASEPLTVRCYQFPVPAGDAPYLPTIARHGMGIEVGPVPPGCLDATIYFQTRRLAHTLLDLIAEYNAGAWPESDLSLDVYTQVGAAPFPRAEDGSLAAMLHPERLHAVYASIHPGDPLFMDFDGGVIPYVGEAGLYTTFVNEPAYAHTNTALCLARLTQRMVQTNISDEDFALELPPGSYAPWTQYWGPGGAGGRRPPPLTQFAGQAGFQPAGEHGQGEGHAEVEQRHGDPDFEGEVGGGHELHALEGELADRDDADDGGIFDSGDELPGQRRHNACEGLGEDDVAQTLQPGQAQGVGRFPLAELHGLDAGADDFGDERALVQSDGNGGRKESSESRRLCQEHAHDGLNPRRGVADKLLHAEHLGNVVRKEKVEDEDKDQGRQVAHELHIPCAQQPEKTRTAGAGQPHKQAKHAAEDGGEHADADGVEEPFQQEVGHPAAFVLVVAQEVLGHGLPAPAIIQPGFHHIGEIPQPGSKQDEKDNVEQADLDFAHWYQS
eukprot:TRINITY_DN2383_c0_g2_i1.p1 TRINITY_DN2383_c0_g2~~TRINITY_DN2383_c0_g2_i1.p1  ORF type:complete len:1264 (+),score=302.28 TRINITY_DN2383_c0_g2_i1:31466-35257(+)